MDWKNTRVGRVLLRLAETYWGRVLLMTPTIGGTFAVLSMLDPSYAHLRLHVLLAVAILAMAARTARQMELAAVPSFVYAGSRIRWTLSEPSAENVALLLSPLMLALALVWVARTRPSIGLSPLLGWIGLPNGRELPVVFAPCGCRERMLHFHVMAIGDEIEFDFGDDYTVNVPKGPPVLNYNLMMRQEGDRTFLRSLDTRC